MGGRSSWGVAVNVGHGQGGQPADGLLNGLALLALKVVFNQPTSGSDSSDEQTATLLSQPFGQWLMGVANKSPLRKSGISKMCS